VSQLLLQSEQCQKQSRLYQLYFMSLTCLPSRQSQSGARSGPFRGPKAGVAAVLRSSTRPRLRVSGHLRPRGLGAHPGCPAVPFPSQGERLCAEYVVSFLESIPQLERSKQSAEKGPVLKRIRELSSARLLK
jgi:hypothetical protein